MTTTATRVLKADRVRLGGPRKLDAVSGPTPAPHAAAPDNPGGAPRARLVRQEPGRAVIEVTCPCGQTVTLECELAPAG